MDDRPPAGWIPVGGQPRRVTAEAQIARSGLASLPTEAIPQLGEIL
jgi:hypothetical protein